MDPADDVLTRLAIAALRPGPNPHAARVIKSRLAKGLDVSLAAVALELGVAASALTAVAGLALDQARRWTADATRFGYDLLSSADPRYPRPLIEIADPPLALWRVGTAGLDGRSVAIVGSRRATPSGLIIARQLSKDLVAHGFTVVSGLAQGVDGAAHEAALAAGGKTVAVLGTGVDVVYPGRHRALSRAIAEAGSLVSEFPPGSPPQAWHFPMRNRIISGLVEAVVVVEAAARSGSLITARLALEQGRDVLAVPGSVVEGRYSGCHALIRDGARLVESVDDILEELNGVLVRARHSNPVQPAFLNELEPVMAKGEPYTIEDLAGQTGRQASAILADLGSLEVQGRVGRLAGGRFVRS